MVSGLIDSDMIPPDVENDDNQQQFRMLVFEYVEGDLIGATNVRLIKVAEWFATGTSVGTSLDDGKHVLLAHIRLERHQV